MRDSGFRRETDENCALTGYNAASSVISDRYFVKTYKWHIRSSWLQGS